jgi:hypothetical protein
MAEELESLRVHVHRGVVLGGPDAPDELSGIEFGPL